MSPIKTPFDQEVDKRIRDVYEEHGFVKSASNGNVIRDEPAVKERAFDVFKAAVVDDKDEKSAKAVTPGEVYAQVFPNGPGADGKIDHLPLEDQAVREKLVRNLWSLTQAKPSGFVQKRLAAEGSSMVLCRAKVMRHRDPVEGAYITDVPELIIDDSLLPQVEKFVRAADLLRNHMDMVVHRHPELESRVAREIGGGVKRATAGLPEKSST